MKKGLVTTLCITVAMACATSVMAKSEKENCPKKKDVETIIKEIGGEHYVEKMKFYEVGSIEVEPTYYHIFNGQLKNGGYHVIFFNNKQEYLGFYYSDYEPTDYEEGAVLLDQGDGENFHSLPVTEKGPGATVRFGGMQSKFVKNPKLEEAAKAAGTTDDGKLVVPEKQKSESGMVIDYRDWTITMKGREITVNAIFVKIDGKNIVIKNAKNGKEASIPGSSLSDEDKEYVKQISAK